MVFRISAKDRHQASSTPGITQAGTASVKRRSPYAGIGVRLGQISVTLPSTKADAVFWPV